MPRITVNEIDSSRYVSPSESAPMVVLVPGTASFGPVFSDANPAVTTFVGEDALADFYNMYGYSPACVAGEGTAVSTIEGDGSFEYATNLLRSGATIQFYRINKGKVATSSDGKISAKHSGRFGNHLVVKVEPVDNVSTDAVIYIYRSKSAFTSADANLTEESLVNFVELYNGRVSTSATSAFYVDTLDIPFIDISAENLATIVKADTLITNLYGGYDFTAEGSEDEQSAEDAAKSMIESLTSSYAHFVDPYLFDFDFVTSGGIVLASDEDAKTGDTITEYGNNSIHLAMKKLVEARKDCEAILDTAITTTATKLVEYAGKKELDSSYCAFYAPWATIVSNTSGATIWAPPSLLFMKAILLGMQSQTESALWYVPAGVARASAPFIIKPYYEIGSTILDEFQNKHKHRINPIMKLRNYGYCVYGNATALHAEPGVPHSALESMNVRIISNVIKKYIFEVCSGLSFDYNNSTLWLKFYSQMDEKLLYMKRHYGLYDYKIQMDSSTVTTQAQNERRVPGKILISPTLAGEFFDIDFEIAPSGVSFTEEGE